MPVTIRNTDILFNNGTTQSTAAVVDTTAVLNATANASVGAVGTYSFLGEASATTTSPGGTRPGSALRYVSINSNGSSWASANVGVNNCQGNGGPPAGTWRAMGLSRAVSDAYGIFCPASVWLRIS